METKSKDKTTDDQSSEKDAMAAILAEAAGTSQAEARRRLDWVIATANDEQRNQLGSALAALRLLRGLGHDENARRVALRIVGRYLAISISLKRLGRRLVGRKRMPGQRMLRIASLLFSRKKVERVFTPLVADYLQELAEVEGENLLKIAAVKLAWWYRFAKACGLDIVLSWVAKIIGACLGH